MKNFDEGRQERKKTREERTFQLHGETFVSRNSIHPDILVDYDNINEDDPSRLILETVDSMIVEMIEPDDDAAVRYRRIREDKEDPVTLEDLMELVKWLIQVQTKRPTGRPGDSSPGPITTETPLTDDSSSPEEPTESTP